MIHIVMAEHAIKCASIGLPVRASEDKDKADEHAKTLNEEGRKKGDYTYYWVESVYKI